ncbi:hypothetical protein KR009_002897 [Drosophila setifemur]|nr:hypothetical protein KR009_002897 [Drosophila setifemur]
MTTRPDNMAWIGLRTHSAQVHQMVLFLLLLMPLAHGFGNEYVHIKVHVPKEEAALEPELAPKVIHHFHHHPHPHQLQQRNRGRPRPKPSPLLESVILSDLDKPLHMSEHADYLNHAKELAEHLAETYAKKPAPPPPPPPPPKKKVNTYTIIEEQHQPQHRPHGYDYEEHPEHSVETYRVIESRPKPHHPHPHHHHHQVVQHHQVEEEDEDVGYHYPATHHSHGIGAYAEPAPVEEHVEQELEPEPEHGYSYSPPSHTYIPPASHSHVHALSRGSKSNRAPAYTLEAPEESPSSSSSAFGYDYSRPGSASSSGFRPSPQVPASDSYGEDGDPADTYGAPPPLATRRRRPSLVDWPESTGFNSAASETYSGVDSYNVGHVQGYGSSGYQYSGPYL